MNFLALCKATAAQCGTIAGVPALSTVAGASGRVAKLVSAVSDAWIDIQNERTDWLWMGRRFLGTLTISQLEYLPAELDVSLTRVGRWAKDTIGRKTFSIYDNAIGASDEGKITYIPYEQWVDIYDFGTHDAGRPIYWSITPLGKVAFGPSPDKAYKARGEYRLKPQVLALDADTPEMPDEFHRVIVWEAIRLLARNDEAFDAINAAGVEYGRLRNALVNQQTPEISMFGGGPLA